MEINNKVNTNSFYRIRDKLLYSSDVRENIALRNNVFTPIFLLSEVNDIRNFEGEQKNKLSYFEMKLKYESENDFGSTYRSLRSRIIEIRKQINLFYTEVLKNKRDIEINFIENDREVKEMLNDFLELKNEFFNLNDDEFVDLFKRFYKILYIINASETKRLLGERNQGKEEVPTKFLANFFRNVVNARNKASLISKKSDVDDDPFLVLFSVFYSGISDINYSVFNIDMLKREINKLFMLNKLNNEFYSLLIDMQVMSMEEILFSENNLGINYVDIEGLAKTVFHNKIGIIENADRLLVIRQSEKDKKEHTETNIYRNFNLDYFDKIKTLDLINIDFKISDEVEERVKNLLNHKAQENLKFFVVTYLIEHGYINYYKGNKLKNITISTKQEKTDEDEKSINKGFIYLKLSEKDLEIEGTLELEFEIKLGLKIVQKKEKLSFSEESIKTEKINTISKIILNSDTEKKYFDGVIPKDFSRGQVDFNLFYKSFKEYFSDKRSGHFLYNDISKVSKERNRKRVPITINRISKSAYCEKIRVNALTGEIVSSNKNKKNLDDVLLHTYLYIYIQSLYLMVRERIKEDKNFKTYKNFSFDSFIIFLNNINVPDTRHSLLRYINYYFYEKYEPFIENLAKYKAISKEGEIIKREIENIINDMDEYILLSKVSEFIYLQILHKFSLDNTIDINLTTNEKIRELLIKKKENGNLKIEESKYIKRIMGYYTEFLEIFEKEFILTNNNNE